ncbi:hypothetical protein [Devosia nitrariae]|uniref:Uncharacterized protein n=1 Tax=Devosia nitrariae TaxID=2071872 RepID=A0ABQ5W0M2_9HYPH|nr:hypothetical protein [Devosia nitrariae]GLQ53615.1 hypothetical protein GCM10010862_08740 [Devosia nitrariae]
MPTKSLGLRRFGGPERYLNFPPPVSATTDEQEPSTSEFIEPLEEADAEFTGIETAVQATEPENPVDDDDDMPLGFFRDAKGNEFIDRVPAFLMRDRPVSNIR